MPNPLRQYVLPAAIAGSLVAVAPAGVTFAAPASPNILLIMADDMGVETVGAYGGTSYATPHIDALAGGGILCTQAYANPLCTPSRVQLLTGQYNSRNYRSFAYLDNDQTTFAQTLQQAGYHTGIVGKWQLSSPELDIKPSGTIAPSVTPQVMLHDYGFEHYTLWQLNQRKSRYWNPTIEENGRLLPSAVDDYGPRIFTDSLKRYITQCVAADQPFLAYYSMALPHDPWQSTPDSAQPWATSESDHQLFADNIRYVDRLVGELVDHLDDPNQDGNNEDSVRANTLVIFLADNGTSPHITSNTQNGPVRGNKGMPDQHGTHVPFIMNWTGTVEPGQVTDRPIDLTDIYATLIEVARVPLPQGHTIDGHAIINALGRLQSNRQAAYLWYDPKGRKFAPNEWVHDGRYKLYRDGSFYDTTSDDEERHPLIVETMDPSQRAHHDALTDILAAYRVKNSGRRNLLVSRSTFCVGDTNQDEQGDMILDNLIVGDNGQNNTEFRTVVGFNLNDIIAVDSLNDETMRVHLDFGVSQIKGTPPSLQVIVIDEVNEQAKARQYSSKGDVLETIEQVTTGDRISIDVTDAVRARVGGSIGFRLEAVGDYPNGPEDKQKRSADQLRFSGDVTGNHRHDDDFVLRFIQPKPTPAAISGGPETLTVNR